MKFEGNINGAVRGKTCGNVMRPCKASPPSKLVHKSINYIGIRYILLYPQQTQVNQAIKQLTRSYLGGLTL